MKYLLGIDVGTTGTKTLLFRQDGALVGTAYRGYPTATPSVGRSEQDPNDWWQAVTETVRELCADKDISQNVAAISLSLQGGTVVPVDAAMHPMRPAIVWSDVRCTAQRQAFAEELGEETMYHKTGWAMEDGLPALQIRWIRENEPEIFKKAAMFLTVPDYISMKMTGIPAVDLSDAGINQLYNLRRGVYDQQILSFCGIQSAQLATPVRSGTVIGHLTEEAAWELGLTTETILVAGAHDQYAVALGAGATKDGDMLIGSGTCWVITCIADAPDFRLGLSQSVAAAANKWGSMCELSAGGVCLEWWRRNLAIGADGNPLSYEHINEVLSRRKAAEDGLFFYPTTGLAGPGRRLRKSTFSGLDLAHDRYDMARAIMEGVAFQIVWMTEQFPVHPSSDGIKLSGGASKSDVWCQIVADIAQVPVRIPEVADLACVGAAILAGVGCGIYRDAADGYRHLAVGERVLQPDPKRAKLYAGLLERYKQNAAALSSLYTDAN